MKRVLFPMVIIVMSILSCQKEKLVHVDDNQNSQSSSTNQEQIFKYSQTVNTFDESGKYFIEQLIRCNDKNIFNEEIENVKSMQLKLTYSSSQRSEVPPTALSNTLKSPQEYPWKKNKDAIYITLKKINIGDAKGFYFESKHKAKSTEEWTGYASINTYYTVYNWSQSIYQADLQFMSGNFPVNVNFFTYNNWLQTQLSSTNSYTSLPVTWGYTSSLSLNRSGPSGVINSVIKIHWVAVPW